MPIVTVERERRERMETEEKCILIGSLGVFCGSVMGMTCFEIWFVGRNI